MRLPIGGHGNEDWIDRVEFYVAFALQVGIAAVTISALLRSQWLLALSGTAVLILTFTPAIIERQLRVPLPVEFTLITCVFLFASFVLGEAGDFYERIWWWDMALHGLSAVITGGRTARYSSSFRQRTNPPATRARSCRPRFRCRDQSCVRSR